MRTFRCIYVNCFNRLTLLAEVSTKLQKIHFFGQFKDHNSGKKHGNQTNDPNFFVYFSRSIHFRVVPPFGSFQSVKYLSFRQKLSIWTGHHTFVENRPPEVTKNPYCLLPQGEPEKGISSWTNSLYQKIWGFKLLVY